MIAITAEDASENDRTRAVRDTARGTKNQTTEGSAGTRQLFRDAIKAVLHRAEDEPTPEPRRRSGDTGRGFGLAARAIVQRAVRLPSAAYAAATEFLSDTLDWLNLWHDNMEGGGEPADICDTKSNHLSPHP
jgi:hypothetical protein